jgi:alkylhydroperoxidase family enzyme
MAPTRIPYPDPAALSDRVNGTIARAPLNVLRMVANASEPVFDGFGQFSAAFYRPSDLDPLLREIAILRVGHLSRSRYEVFHHEGLGRQLGLGDDQIAAIARGEPDPALTAAQNAVMAFADDIIVNVRAGDDTLAAVRGHVSDQALVDLILVTGLYMTVSRLLETAGVELDAAPLASELVDQTAG